MATEIRENKIKLKIISNAKKGIRLKKNSKPFAPKKISLKRRDGFLYGAEVVDPELVRKMINAHCTTDEICDMLGYSINTLKTRMAEQGIDFDTLFKARRAAIKRKLRAVMLKKALAGDSRMIIWATKNYLGMTDRQEIKNTIDINLKVKTYSLPINGRETPVTIEHEPVTVTDETESDKS